MAISEKELRRLSDELRNLCDDAAQAARKCKEAVELDPDLWGHLIRTYTFFEETLERLVTEADDIESTQFYKS